MDDLEHISTILERVLDHYTCLSEGSEKRFIRSELSEIKKIAESNVMLIEASLCKGGE